MLKTLDATLQRTRSECERTFPEEEFFEPAALVERVAGLFRPLARRKGLAVHINADVADRVIGRPAGIQQILANFMSNAIKFTPSGTVTVGCTPPEDGGNEWTFSVEDTGGGIAPDRMKTIFEPFSGTAPDTLGRSSGSGLGLSITRDIAQEMGGRVEARSADRGGTLMVLIVPLQSVVSGEEVAARRGTIDIQLSEASLALRVEILADACGFSALPVDATEDGDIFVCGDHEAVMNSDAKLKIEVSQEGEVRHENGYVKVSQSELLDILPGLIESHFHG